MSNVNVIMNSLFTYVYHEPQWWIDISISILINWAWQLPPSHTQLAEYGSRSRTIAFQKHCGPAYHHPTTLGGSLPHVWVSQEPFPATKSFSNTFSNIISHQHSSLSSLLTKTNIHGILHSASLPSMILENPQSPSPITVPFSSHANGYTLLLKFPSVVKAEPVSIATYQGLKEGERDRLKVVLAPATHCPGEAVNFPCSHDQLIATQYIQGHRYYDCLILFPPSTVDMENFDARLEDALISINIQKAPIPQYHDVYMGSRHC